MYVGVSKTGLTTYDVLMNHHLDVSYAVHVPAYKCINYNQNLNIYDRTVKKPNKCASVVQIVARHSGIENCFYNWTY